MRGTHEGKDCFLGARSWGSGPQAGRVSPYSTQMVQRPRSVPVHTRTNSASLPLALVHGGNSPLVKLTWPLAPASLSCDPVPLPGWGGKPPPASHGCHLEVVDVVFSVKVNALGLFVDGHDRQSDINGAMELPLGDLGWRDQRRKRR